MSDAAATLLSGAIVALLAVAGALFRLGQVIGELKSMLKDVLERVADLEDWRSALRHGGGLVPQAPHPEP
jgi:hypothetical protein